MDYNKYFQKFKGETLTVADAANALAALRLGPTVITPAAYTLLDDTTVAAMRATLLLESMALLAAANIDTPMTFTGGAAAAAVLQRFGASITEGFEIRAIDETTAVLDSLHTDLTENVPAGAVILSVQANIETAVTGGSTTTKIGIGEEADPDKYGLSADLAKNTKIDTIPDWAVVADAEDIKVNACADAGTDGDTKLTVGTVRVRIIYAVPVSLDDAA